MQDERLMCQHQMNEPNMQGIVLIQDSEATTSLTPVPPVKKLSWVEMQRRRENDPFSTATNVIHQGINVVHLMSLLSRTSNLGRLW